MALGDVNKTRRLIFISHATPDDNEITRWLCRRLAARGFRVWADIEQLGGGDRFWSDIQNAIRNDAARFISIVSRNSVGRDGVLNELAEARDVSVKLKDPRFIIPIKADDQPWSDFPIQLKQLNGLDFSKDWATGLDGLLTTLKEDSIPLDHGDPEVSRVARLFVAGREQVVQRAEWGLLNWMPVHSLPVDVHYYLTSMSSDGLREARSRIKIPTVAHDRLLISFAEIDALRAALPGNIEVEHRHTQPLEEFLAGEPERGPQVRRQQAHGYLTDILRQALEHELRRKGLAQFDRRWFVPNGWRDKNQGWYVGVEGRHQYRALVGKAKDLTWHFAVATKVRAWYPRRIHLEPNVLFSPDGMNPLPDQKQLRRRHCKLWWNDKWRDLLLAFIAELVGPAEGRWTIDLGGGALMELSTSLMRVRIPVSYSDDRAHIPDADEDKEWEDDQEEAPFQ